MFGNNNNNQRIEQLELLVTQLVTAVNQQNEVITQLQEQSSARVVFKGFQYGAGTGN